MHPGVLAPLSPGEWDVYVRDHFVPGWLEDYEAGTPWPAEVLEIEQGPLTYLFDGTPSMSGADNGDDRVVAVWGQSAPAGATRDKGRQAGFIPVPERWSHVGMDRGHFVAHAAGGGMDMNFFPQARGLNRGTSERGKVWKAMERLAIERPGTSLFVRPLYDDGSWVPALIDYGVMVETGLWEERFENQD
jgi:hypothetical protein